MRRQFEERSAGGLVLRNKKILMVKVKNLEGKIRWTFPKGHIEREETALEAARREVLEETGWKCSLLRQTQKGKKLCSSRERILPFLKVHYQFKRAGLMVHKEVLYFLMRPIKKMQARDPDEILQVGWFSLKQARKIALYPSDKKLLAKLQRAQIFS